MDYSVITQEIIEKRFSILPEKIRTVLDSEKNREITKKICAENFLDEEQSLIIEQLTAMILLGFVNQKEFQTELIASAGLTEENSAKIADTVKEKILIQAGDDLGRIYSPPPTTTVREIREEAVKETVAIRTPIDAIAPAATPEPTPFVLYQDKQQKPATEERKPLNRPFSFSFGIFKTPAGAASRNEVQARIETAQTNNQEKEKAQTVKLTVPSHTVHYSEFRSPISPFGGDNITNLNKPEKAPPTNPPADESVIDLRNL